MLSFINKIWKKYVLRKNDAFTVEDTDVESIPFHVRQLGRLYPILHTVAANQARGEIRKFNFCESQKNTLPVGRHVSMTEGEYETLWVCLGNDYFKLLMKA